jgi:hypothetical protein
MSRSARDPNLESLASAVQETRRAKKRPSPAANTGPIVAVIVVAVAAAATFAVYRIATRDRPAGNAIAATTPQTPEPTADPVRGEVKPVHAAVNPHITVGDDQAVLVTFVSAKVGPVELFPVKKPKPAPTTQSKLFGKIPEPDEQPKMSKPLLTIRLRVQNRSGAPIDYSTWNDATPVLADDAGNVYGFCQFTEALPEGRLRGRTTIGLNESVEELLIFDRVPATIRALDLRLPGQNVGASQPILVPISPSEISGL